jgi:hypothetical protein
VPAEVRSLVAGFKAKRVATKPATEKRDRARKGTALSRTSLDLAPACVGDEGIHNKQQAASKDGYAVVETLA